MRRYAAMLIPLLCASAAMAQDGPEKDDDDDDKKGPSRAETIVTQPVRDVGIQKTKIPEVLKQAVKQPYASPGARCSQIVESMTELNAVLGPDFDGSSKENKNRLGNLAAAGGTFVVNSLIPFRGIVREISGAGPAQRRLDTAIDAGLARRGYLRGLAVSRGCALPAPPDQEIEEKK